MMSFVRRSVVNGWRALQAVWLVIGVCVLLLLILEGSIRLAMSLRAKPVGIEMPVYLATASWSREYMREFNTTLPVRWAPYIYWRRHPSFHGRYITIDRLGRRVTPQPKGPNAPSARVYFFGGSTMWGWFQRDDHTIAAEAVRRLQTVAGPGKRIDVANFGETGFVFTQELIELMLQLRAGNRPDVVVFYDGINDISSVLENRVAGLTLNEGKRVNEFELGRLLDAGNGTVLRKDLHGFARLAWLGLGHLATTAAVKSLVHPAAAKLLPADSAARAMIRAYVSNVRIVEALSQAFGFRAIYVWQPTLYSSQKRLTATERDLMSTILADPVAVRRREVHLAAPPLLDSAMATLAPGRFVNASGLFDGDTSTVYVDKIGHNTEASIPAIVDAFWPVLEAAVARHEK